MYKPALKGLRSEDVLVSIGGDIFCYENYRKYNLLHQYALKQVKHSILIGCSIEPDSLTDHALLKDLETFEFISARELITYNALKNAGLKNVSYCQQQKQLCRIILSLRIRLESTSAHWF